MVYISRVSSPMRTTLFILTAASLLAAACGNDPDYLSREELLDPETCKSCHPTHYQQWSGSMHAYAADDPVFLAMNRRGQRETNGELGSFCINCHAPMAVLEGATTDGLNLEDADFPKHLKGVTCFFCHSVDSITEDHNNGLQLATDNVIRGGISDPFPNDAHRSTYSPLHDRNSQESSRMCGSCHDIKINGVHLERTFLEWQNSLFGDPDPRKHLSCGRCHMVGDQPGVVADYPGVPSRFPHEHTWPGIDTALIEWPEKQAQLEGIQRDLRGAINPKLCVGPAAGGIQITYNLDNVFAGHMVPSGATADRRMWAEIVVYDGDTVVFESGVIPDGQAVADSTDPNLWQMRDFTEDSQGDEAHMFWDVVKTSGEECNTAPLKPDPTKCFLLPPSVTNDPADPNFIHSVERQYTVVGVNPTRVTAKVYIRAIGLEILQDLVDSGDLDDSFIALMPTLLIEGTVLEWTGSGPDDFGCVTR